jgi:predicted acyl esterase
MGHLFSNRPFYYHDRTGMEEKKRFVSFMTIPLSISEIVGEAELNLFFSIDQPNVHLFAYLEDVDLTPAFSNENKRKGITYITEAIWNPIHHGHTNSTSLFFKKNARPEKIKPNTVYEATFKFQPIAYVLKRNHQLRVSIGLTSYQKDFTTSSQLGATKLTIHFGGKYPSALKIPLYDGIYEENLAIDKNKKKKNQKDQQVQQQEKEEEKEKDEL